MATGEPVDHGRPVALGLAWPENTTHFEYRIVAS
jgi:hypothetical protein